jgi:DNA helicase-2/ATP-dependent DNA helicase PcrA
MNAAQKAIISHKHGPLLVVAGPGSGKTRSVTLLAMNLLLCGDAEPSQIVLCTYTEKAAYELQDRLGSIARGVQYAGDLSRLRVGTIHGICQQLIDEYLHETSLSSGYDTLDQFHQRLLVFDHLAEICPGSALPFLQDRWGTNWEVAKHLASSFDTIAEELILEKLQEDKPRLARERTVEGTLLCSIIDAYEKYRKVLFKTNSTDFAHLQKWTHKLLSQPETLKKITSTIRYVLVDEYQDTNYIQEQILTQLASSSDPKNLIAIGDEDQALYRFRGATVRNILTFAQKISSDCSTIQLTTNYRSRAEIIATCDRWIRDFNWTTEANVPLRTEKTLVATKISSNAAPAVMHLVATDMQDEAEQFADLVVWLKTHGKIADYGDVALLLYSVRFGTSDPYIQALKKREIPAYCPRAGTFFEQPEIRLLFGCFARLLHYSEKTYHSPLENDSSATYLTSCLRELATLCQRAPLHPLVLELQKIEKEIKTTSEQEERTDGQCLAGYFYRLLFCEPFLSEQKQESKKGNLVQFSRLLDTFQKRYSHQVTPTAGWVDLSAAFFERFFAFLYREGMNEEEDQQRPFLKGHVQIMTIHQAKGLEFPVVVVGRLDKPPSRFLEKERVLLQPYFQHPPFEPLERIPGCDRKRLYYVAFSRARDLLVLSAVRKPQRDFLNLWQTSLPWQERRERPHIFPIYESLGDRELPKPRYGVTTHIQTYQTCPRRYHYFYEQRFAPSHRVDVLFGQLVHQTIELLHRQVLADSRETLDEARVKRAFDKIALRLQHTSIRAISAGEREQAWQQVLNYYQQNQQLLRSMLRDNYRVRWRQ